MNIAVDNMKMFPIIVMITMNVPRILVTMIMDVQISIFLSPAMIMMNVPTTGVIIAKDVSIQRFLLMITMNVQLILVILKPEINMKK